MQPSFLLRRPRRSSQTGVVGAASLVHLLFLVVVSTSSFGVVVVNVMALSSSSSSSTPTTKVAVIGGTGRLGRETVDQLLSKGIPVKCLVRPSSKIPDSWTSSSSVEIVRGNIVGDGSKATITDLVKDCTHCLALYGATRKSKISDIWSPTVEDTDLDHAKQVNYESIKTLVDVCTSDDATSTCKEIIRITGKGEDPTSFFSVLINMLGSMAKGWNYEGETVLRSAASSNDDFGYTIIRPGIMKPADDVNLDGDGTAKNPPQHLELSDNGGNDLKVSAVSYRQIAELIVGCVTVGTGKTTTPPSRRRVTLSAMNVPGAATMTLEDQIQNLKPDTRQFPTTLIEQHKAAVARVVKIIAAGLTGIVAVVVGSIMKMIT
jgi:NAD(P)H-binding